MTSNSLLVVTIIFLSTPLMLAAAEGRIGILKILLQSRPNAELKDEKGCTAIDHAIINNNNNKLSISIIVMYECPESIYFVALSS